MDTLIDWGSFLIQIINFAIVAYVLRRFFFVPYLQFLDEEALKRKDLEEKLAKQSHILEEAHNQAANLVDQAKVDARMVASEIIDNARKEGKELAEKATKDAELTRSKGFADEGSASKNWVQIPPIVGMTKNRIQNSELNTLYSILSIHVSLNLFIFKNGTPRSSQLT